MTDPAAPAEQAWLDWRGNIITAPYSEEPTGYNWDDQHTHRLMRPQPGQLVQAVTWCGRRALEVPGRGPIDCPECQAAIAEAR
jgi:hypothetical protein